VRFRRVAVAVAAGGCCGFRAGGCGGSGGRLLRLLRAALAAT
jgi:hypothetical protein